MSTLITFKAGDKTPITKKFHPKRISVFMRLFGTDGG